MLVLVPTPTLLFRANAQQIPYQPVDISFQALIPRRETDTSVPVQADTLQLPFSKEQFHVAHTRFVLAHLNPAQLPQALKEPLRVSQLVVALDFDWTTFTGPPIINQFITAARTFFRMEKSSFNPDFGHTSPNLILTALTHTPYSSATLQTQRFTRPAGIYYKEIIPLAKTFLELSQRLNYPQNLTSQFQSSLEALTQAQDQSHPQEFTPPAIVSVTISP